jgi:hypothetical protein
MDSERYYELYRCHETSSDPISENEEGAAYISRRSSAEVTDFAAIEG